jgi:subtilisin family serine protease
MCFHIVATNGLKLDLNMQKLISSILFFLVLFTGFAQDMYVSPAVKAQLASHQQTSFFLVLHDQIVFPPEMIPLDKKEKGRTAFNMLLENAKSSQASLINELKTQGVQHKHFIIANAILVKGDLALLNQMRQHPLVAKILPNHIFVAEKVVENREVFDRREEGLPWGLELIRADQVWRMGFRGQGVIIGGQDTGYDWDHPALINNYRGFNEGMVDHNYNWHDAIHDINPSHNDPDSILQPNPCGLDQKEPCDDLASHGTHTMGIAIGNDDQQDMITGVAPEAKWIGARNMDRGIGSPQTYLEAFEWFLAPTDLNNENPNPDLAPHVITNSWSCPEKEGCHPDNFILLETAINNLRSAGIMVVASAGNNGSSGCASIYNPPAIFENTFTIGSIDSNDSLSSFSSKGPVEIDSSGRLKPNVSAPGRGVLSSISGGGYGMKSGTSMASPHVAGLVALIISAAPELAGQVEVIEDIIEKTAIQKLEPDSCTGSRVRSALPNMLHGYGRIDALAAVQEALEVTSGNDLSRGDPLKIYPNPVKDKFNIDFNGHFPGNLQFFRSDGTLIFEEEMIYSGVHEISVSTWPAGIYGYRFFGKGQIRSGIIVVVH